MTCDLFVGRFAARERLAELRQWSVTDILNVSDSPCQLAVRDGPFRTVTWIPVEDRMRIPTCSALNAMDVIHRALGQEAGRVYVHCMAGWNRSPTILWLYLMACGFEPAEAVRCICANAYDAVPGHALLVDASLMETVRDHGRARYLPHPRPAAIAPLPAPTE